MKLSAYINFHKLLSGVAVLGLIAVYNQWENTTAWVYLALHGTYGVLWNLKGIFFPDRKWMVRTSWVYGVFVAWGSLTLYWAAPWILCLNGIKAPPWYLCGCISLFVFGVFLHYGSDLQKAISLKFFPDRLVTVNFWALCRNPNYFEELLIYLSLALLAMHWIPLVILGMWVGLYWLPNMRKKDQSLLRYPDFDAYKARTKLFIPFIF